VGVIFWRRPSKDWVPNPAPDFGQAMGEAAKRPSLTIPCWSKFRHLHHFFSMRMIHAKLSFPYGEQCSAGLMERFLAGLF